MIAAATAIFPPPPSVRRALPPSQIDLGLGLLSSHLRRGMDALFYDMTLRRLMNGTLVAKQILILRSTVTQLKSMFPSPIFCLPPLMPSFDVLSNELTEQKAHASTLALLAPDSSDKINDGKCAIMGLLMSSPPIPACRFATSYW